MALWECRLLLCSVSQTENIAAVGRIGRALARAVYSAVNSYYEGPCSQSSAPPMKNGRETEKEGEIIYQNLSWISETELGTAHILPFW